MSASLKYDGLDLLYAELRRLPDAMRQDAAHLVESAAVDAALEIRSEYALHRDTGDLQDRVEVVHETTGYGARSFVRSKAKHAHLFEFGTQRRKNQRGANRGAMPAGNVFVPVMMRARFAMLEGLAAIVHDAGFEVRRG